MPRLASNAGRGIGIVIRARSGSRVPTAGSLQERHVARGADVARRALGWCVCGASRSPLLAWQPVHWPSSKRPSSFFPKTSRYFCECGSWQSVHVIEPLT